MGFYVDSDCHRYLQASYSSPSINVRLWSKKILTFIVSQHCKFVTVIKGAFWMLNKYKFITIMEGFCHFERL